MASDMDRHVVLPKIFQTELKYLTKESMPYTTSVVVKKSTGFSEFARKNVLKVMLDEPIFIEKLKSFKWQIHVCIKGAYHINFDNEYIFFEGTDELEPVPCYGDRTYWFEVGDVKEGKIESLSLFRKNVRQKHNLVVTADVTITEFLPSEEQLVLLKAERAEKADAVKRLKVLLKGKDDLLSSLLEGFNE